jgi:hypothetical protein
MNKRYLILPHMAEALARRHLLLRGLHRALAMTIFPGHGDGLDLEGRKLL